MRIDAKRYKDQQHYKNHKFFFFGCIIFFVLILLIRLSFSPQNPLFFPAVFLITCINFYKTTTSDLKRKEVLLSFVFSVFFGLAISVGSSVHYIHIRAGISDNFLRMNLNVLAMGGIVSLVLWPNVVSLAKVDGKLIKRCLKKDHKKHIFWLAWALILSGWLPYLLSFYPGGIVGDGAITIEEALHEGLPSTNHWVVTYILFIRFFLRIASLLPVSDNQSLHIGIFLYVVFSMLFVSGTCAGVCVRISKHGFSIWFVWLCIAFYSFSGFFASHSMSLWKDATYGAGVVLLSLLLWDIRDTPKTLFLFTLLSLFLCFWRNNGIYLLLLVLIGLIVLLKSRAYKFIICGMAVVIITNVVTGPVYSAVGIKNDSLRQSASIPLQQIAATINSNVELSQEQKDILFIILPEETWRRNYCPALSDDLKNSIDDSVFEEHFRDFLRVWGQLLIPNFKIYVKAYLMQTLGFWQPFVHRGNYYDYWFGIQDIFSRGYHKIDIWEKITKISISENLMNQADFISSGTIVWILFLSTVLILMQPKTGYKRLLPILPLLGSWVIIMIATPIAYAYRYIFMLPLAFPVLLVLPFEQEKFTES